MASPLFVPSSDLTNPDIEGVSLTTCDVKGRRHCRHIPSLQLRSSLFVHVGYLWIVDELFACMDFLAFRYFVSMKGICLVKGSVLFKKESRRFYLFLSERNIYLCVMLVVKFFCVEFC